MWGIWFEFGLCCVIISAAGARLVRHGHALADLTGLSRGWVGLVLVATVTSLPELVTGISAVSLAGSPNLALGDALGSCLFNLALVALAGRHLRSPSSFAVPPTAHLASARMGIGLMALVAIGLAGMDRWLAGLTAHIGASSLLILVGYLLAMRRLRVIACADIRAPAGGAPAAALRQAIIGYVSAAILIVAAGAWLPIVGLQIARAMRWSDSFVGTLLIALATSVPELATTLAALRLRQFDLMLGNLLGSNLFDLLIVSLDDAAYLPGPMLAHASKLHHFTLAIGIAMYAVVIAALRAPNGRIASACAPLLVGGWLLNVLIQHRG